MTTIVLGSQFGDEGKGKLVDLLSSKYGLCARAAGGDNAGHTVIADGKSYDFHLIPSSLLTPTTTNVIGSGCVVHVPSFFKELEALEAKGLNAQDRLFISDRAHVVFDLHQLVDGLEEAELGSGKAVGTTKRGIGPCYSQKAARSGVRIGEIFNKETMDQKLRATATGNRKRYGDLLGGYDVEAEIERYAEYRERLRPYVVDQIPLIQSAETMLVEGANALLLDVDYGTYPMVTSSNTGIGGVFTGLAISPFKIKDIIGVVKAYMSRVGNGPFPTEESSTPIGEKLQSIGREYGVTTGRKRRCGWLDLVAIRHSTAVNHYTALNLTKLDILDTFPEIKVATAYRSSKASGEILPSFPADLDTLSDVEVVYETLPGWQEATTGAQSYDELPLNARKYIEFIERDVGVKIQWIGTGPGRESMITR